jgi:hypothetical protein
MKDNSRNRIAFQTSDAIKILVEKVVVVGGGTDEELYLCLDELDSYRFVGQLSVNIRRGFNALFCRYISVHKKMAAEKIILSGARSADF